MSDTGVWMKPLRLFAPHPTIDLIVSVFRLIKFRGYTGIPLLVVPAKGKPVWSMPVCDPDPHPFEEADEEAIYRDRAKFERLLGIGTEPKPLIHFFELGEDEDEYDVISSAADYLKMQRGKAN